MPCLAICDRELSVFSIEWPWSSGDRVGESSVSSATGEPDECLCIGGVVETHPEGEDLGTQRGFGHTEDPPIEMRRRGKEGRGERGREGVLNWNVGRSEVGREEEEEELRVKDRREGVGDQTWRASATVVYYSILYITTI